MADFLTELRDRRILPAVGVYVASVWVLIEILDRLVERYLLSPYLTDIVFWGLYSLIPAVMLVAWTHGRPGKDKATRLEKVGVPINVIATIGLLLTVFGGANLNSAAKQITVNNEFGEQETHFITSETYRRRMAVFFWTNESGNPELDWLQYGITELLVQDLQQDPFVLANSPWNNFQNGSYPRMRQAGFEDGLNVPRTLMREIADRAHRQYFVEGSLGQVDGEYLVTARIWNTQSLEQVAELTEHGWDLYAVIDQLSKETRKALDVPKSSSRIAEDLPLVETYGESEDALKAYIQGLNARLFENDFEASNNFFDQATSIDPNFVLAWFLKAANLAESGDLPSAQEALSEAQKLDYRLPSSNQAQLKILNYQLSGEHEKLMAFLNLQAKIRDDSTSHSQLAGMYMLTGELEKAKTESLLALDRDALNIGIYLRMSMLERATDNMEAAINYARSYQEQRPEDIEAHLVLGDLFRDSGKLDDAEKHYKQAQILENDPVWPVLRLSVIAARKGDINAAREYLSEAEGFANKPMEETHVRQAAADLEERLGNIREAIRLTRAQEEFRSQSSGLLDQTLNVYMRLIGYYVALDDLGAARSALNTAKNMLTPPMDKFLGFSEVGIFASEKDINAANASLQQVREVIEQFQLKHLDTQMLFIEAVISEAEGDFVAVAQHYFEVIDSVKHSVVGGNLILLLPQVYAELAKAQVATGDLHAAEHSIGAGFLLDPTEPRLWVAQALLQKDRNIPKLALASVNYALAIWSDADEEYVEAKKARALVVELQAAGQ